MPDVVALVVSAQQSAPAARAVVEAMFGSRVCVGHVEGWIPIYGLRIKGDIMNAIVCLL